MNEIILEQRSEFLELVDIQKALAFHSFVPFVVKEFSILLVLTVLEF